MRRSKVKIIEKNISNTPHWIISILSIDFYLFWNCSGRSFGALIYHREFTDQEMYFRPVMVSGCIDFDDIEMCAIEHILENTLAAISLHSCLQMKQNRVKCENRDTSMWSIVYSFMRILNIMKELNNWLMCEVNYIYIVSIIAIG